MLRGPDMSRNAFPDLEREYNRREARKDEAREMLAKWRLSNFLRYVDSLILQGVVCSCEEQLAASQASRAPLHQEDQQEPDVDVCQVCGVYYFHGHLKEREWKRTDGDIAPQRCVKCWD